VLQASDRTVGSHRGGESCVPLCSKNCSSSSYIGIIFQVRSMNTGAPVCQWHQGCSSWPAQKLPWRKHANEGKLMVCRDTDACPLMNWTNFTLVRPPQQPYVGYRSISMHLLAIGSVDSGSSTDCRPAGNPMTLPPDTLCWSHPVGYCVSPMELCDANLKTCQVRALHCSSHHRSLHFCLCC